MPEQQSHTVSRADGAAAGRSRRNRSQSLGTAGEEYAAAYLQELGWSIIERNWRCRDGEVDIIAVDGSTVVFCEVKTRSHDGSGHPLEHVHFHKLQKLQQLAVRWLSAQSRWYSSFRIDAIGVVWNSGSPAVSHIRGAQ